MPVKQHIIVFGPSGSGKTNLLRTFAEGFHAKTGKKVRLVSGESAQKGPIEPAIRSGIVEPWWIDNANFPFERVREATQGGWPTDTNDPLSPVVPAFAYKYAGKCNTDGTLVYQSEKPPQSVLTTCCKCKAPVTIRTVRELNPANGIDKVGAYLFEGCTAFGEMFMDNMSDRSARGEKMGEDVAVRFRDGQLDIAASSRSSYGIAQRRVKAAVGESRHLPVDYCIWTATLETGQDEDARIVVFGPKLPGSKATADVPRWFGPSLSATWCPVTGKDKEFRLYLKTFYHTWLKGVDTIPVVCNNRIPADQLDATVPNYFVVKPDDKTFLWRVVEMIDSKQAITPPATEAKK